MLFWWFSPFPVLRHASLVPLVNIGDITNGDNTDIMANTNNTDDIAIISSTGNLSDENIPSNNDSRLKHDDKVVVIAKMKTENTENTENTE
jgi:hypothetical protein